MLLDNPCRPDRRVQKEAAALVAAGHEVTILAWDRDGTLPLHDSTAGATIERVRVRSSNNRGLGQVTPTLRFWMAALRRGRGMDFDLVHCHDLPTLPVGMALAAFTGRPLVYDAHEIYPLMMHSRLPAVACRALAVLERRLMRRATRVITVSDMLVDHYRGVRDDIEVVGNWYDPIHLDPAAGTALRMRLGIPPEAFVLSYVGFFGPERRYDLLLDYAAAHPEVTVVIAGTGAGEPEVTAAASLRPNLHYLGVVADPDPIFAAADALFYGLADGDPYSNIISPNNLFQSIAMRRPLIAVGPGDATRVIRATGAGVVLDEPTVDALHSAVDALRAPERRAEIDAAQVRLQSVYSWSMSAQVLLRVHDEAAAGVPSTAKLWAS